MNNVAVKVVLTVLLVGLMAYSVYTIVHIAGIWATESETTDATLRLPPGASLEDVALVDTSGKRFDFAALQGQVWVGSMFFSKCPFECAQLNQQIQQLTEDAELADVRFISVSVDPENDTPEVLAEYAERFAADAKQWTFLTGPMTDIAVFGTKILRVQTGVQVHTPRLVLIDGEGKIRGAFLFSDADEMAKLRLAAARLQKAETTNSQGAGE
ncbi:MAG: SCO family protein [Pirellulales bacterium]